MKSVLVVLTLFFTVPAWGDDGPSEEIKEASRQAGKEMERKLKEYGIDAQVSRFPGNDWYWFITKQYEGPMESLLGLYSRRIESVPRHSLDYYLRNWTAPGVRKWVIKYQQQLTACDSVEEPEVCEVAAWVRFMDKAYYIQRDYREEIEHQERAEAKAKRKAEQRRKICGEDMRACE